MSNDRPYVRVYYGDMIRDYPDVWSDDHQLATWLRLLATADPMWPTPPELPRSVKPRALSQLVDSSLVSVADHRFRIKGLDAERNARSASARNAAAVRWHSEGIPGPDATAMPKRIQAESETEPSRAESPRDPADIYWTLTGKYPGEKVLPWIDRLASTYGSEAVIRHLTGAHIEDRSVSSLLGRTENALRAEARQLDVEERRAEEARIAEKRRPVVLRTAPDDVSPEEAARLAAEHERNFPSGRRKAG